MQSILHHNASGNVAFTGNLKNKEVHSAITLHPVKKPQVMYRLYVYMEGLRAQERRQEALLLHRDILTMVKLLHMDKSNKFIAPGVPILPTAHLRNESFLGDAEVLSQSPKLKKFDSDDLDELLDWNFISKYIYSAHHSNPKHRVETALKEGLEDVIREIMENINNFSRQRGRIIEFKDILYAYRRVNALHGQDLILDLLLLYKKYRGKKMTVQVRRHLYVQRSFTDIKIREFVVLGQDSSAVSSSPRELPINLPRILRDHVKGFLNTRIDQFMKGQTQKTFNAEASGSSLVSSGAPNDLPNIIFILPLVGRPKIFQRFLDNFEEVCLLNDANCHLLVALFVDSDYNENLAAINVLQQRYPHGYVRFKTMQGSFSRGLALDEASRDDKVAPGDILFFIDVDITFTHMTLDRIRVNTVRKQQVYLPIVFSDYNSNPNELLGRARDSSSGYHDNNTVITDENGYFREYGYGLCAIFKSDLFSPGIGGFVNDIKGWGLEDVKFLDRIVAANREASINNILVGEIIHNTNKVHNYLSIFRAADTSLRHIFHEITCDKGLQEAQYKMCLGTKANTMGSYRFVEQLLLKDNATLFPVPKEGEESNRRRRSLGL